MSHRPRNLDDDFLAPVPTWLVGEMFTDEYPGTVQLAPGRHEFIAAEPRKKAKALSSQPLAKSQKLGAKS